MNGNAKSENTPDGHPVQVGSWQRKTRSIAYENRWITLHHDEVIQPDGNPGIYGVVHYHNRSVGVVALDDQDRVLLVGQFRYTLGRYSWEIPAGGCPTDEQPSETAFRELKEETGFTAKSMQLLLHAHMSNSISDEEGFCFLAEDLTPGPPAREGTEDITMKWIDFAEALQCIASGEITDALTILALQQTAIRRFTKCQSEGDGPDSQ